MKLLKIGGYVLLSMLLSITAHGQNASKSPYSIYGIGTLLNPQSSLTKSMGGTGIAVRDPLLLNNSNPASLNALSPYYSMAFEVGTYFQKGVYSTESSTETFKNGGITNLNLLFRLNKKWAAMIGLRPLSDVSFSVVNEGQIESLGISNAVEINQDGGVYKFYLGNAYEVAKNLSLGMNASLIFGNLERSDYVQLTTLGTTYEVESLTNVSSADLDFGLQYTVPFPKSRLTIGATFDYKTTLKTDQEKSLLDSSLDTLINDTYDIDNYELPTTYGAGLSYSWKRHTVSADFTTQLWQDISLPEAPDLQNAMRYSVGYQRAGVIKKDNYWSLISFRAGAYYQNEYLKIKGHSLDTWGGSAGVGIPLSQSFQIDLSYEYTHRGQTDYNMIQEEYHTFHFDVIVRDIWNKKRLFD